MEADVSRIVGHGAPHGWRGLAFGNTHNAAYRNLALEKSTGNDPEIRILHLRNRNTLAIECTLVTAKLSDKPTYKALSYTWGEEDDQDVSTIYVNGSPFTITRNLWDALWALRPQSGEIVLWVDAICINQFDTQERSHQVSCMPDIYRTASEVIVWLGPSTPRTDLVLKHLSEKKLTAESLKGLRELSKRRWFTRFWVIQELALSLGNATIHCGKHHIVWNELVTNFVEKRIFVHDAHLTQIYEEIYDVLANLDKFVSLAKTADWVKAQDMKRITRAQSESARGGLADFVVTAATNFSASDPKDKIYALLYQLNGVTFADAGEPNLAVDYGKSLEEIQEDCSRHIIAVQGNFDYVLLEQYVRNPGLPSWVWDTEGAQNEVNKTLFPPMWAAHFGYTHSILRRPEKPMLQNDCISWPGYEIATVKSVESNSLALLRRALTEWSGDRSGIQKWLHKSLLRRDAAYKRWYPLISYLAWDARDPSKVLDGILRHRAVFMTTDGMPGIALNTVRAGDIIVHLPSVPELRVLRPLGKTYHTLHGKALLHNTQDDEYYDNCDLRLGRFRLRENWTTFLIR
nr:hypothetical protein B0A51_14484 [Rachicladosporium sp. CCFEE 5018]